MKYRLSWVFREQNTIDYGPSYWDHDKSALIETSEETIEEKTREILERITIRGGCHSFNLVQIVKEEVTVPVPLPKFTQGFEKRFQRK